MDGAKLITERQAGTDPALGITSDAREIPTPSDGSKPIGWWIAARSTYQGTATTDQDGEPQNTTCEGTTVLAVTAERVIGIVSPNDDTSPAVWFSWSRSSLDIQTAGSQGLFKKRPVTITLTLDGSTIELSAVSRLYRNSGRYQDGQEGSLMRALDG